jgi:hypothetical protein
MSHREFLFYSPEVDAFVVMWIMPDCYIGFEWAWDDMHRATKMFDGDPADSCFLIALGEI